MDRDWVIAQVAVFAAKVITDHAIDHKSSIGVRRRSENFAARKITPFLRRNQAARLDPFEFRRELAFEIAAVQRATFDPLGATSTLDQALTERVNLAKIGAHSFEHDLTGDVHHVSMTNMMSIHDFGHVASHRELAGLTLRREDRHLRSSKIVQNVLRHVSRGTLDVIFQKEHRVFRTDFFHFGLQRGRDIPGRLIRDDGNALLGFELKTNTERIARPRREFRINRVGGQTVRHLGRTRWREISLLSSAGNALRVRRLGKLH